MKSKPLSWYKKKLWRVFAKWIKIRDKHQCFTCGKKCFGADCHGGHFKKASCCGLLLYFHEDNVHCQCARCNLWMDGMQYEYGVRLGKKKVAELDALERISKKTIWSRADYEKKIEFYEKKYAELISPKTP